MCARGGSGAPLPPADRPPVHLRYASDPDGNAQAFVIAGAADAMRFRIMSAGAVRRQAWIEALRGLNFPADFIDAKIWSVPVA